MHSCLGHTLPLPCPYLPSIAASHRSFATPLPCLVRPFFAAAHRSSATPLPCLANLRYASARHIWSLPRHRLTAQYFALPLPYPSNPPVAAAFRLRAQPCKATAVQSCPIHLPGIVPQCRPAANRCITELRQCSAVLHLASAWLFLAYLSPYQAILW